MKKKFICIILSIFILTACSTVTTAPDLKNVQNVEVDHYLPKTDSMPVKKMLIAEPISDALTRVTKKPFGIKISPNNSPVQPEKFSGYHTGTDFEVTIDEQNSNVNIYAICDGKLIYRKYVSGYGGVVIQQCHIQNNDVTVLYGHLKLNSISATVNQIIKKDEKIGVLGKAYSTETDGERKHLHLSIHKGQTVNLLGYVQNKSLLDDWLDPVKLMQN